MEFTSGEQITQAQQQAEKLKRLLETQILGRKLNEWQCNCGALHASEAIAVHVVFPDDRYSPTQKTLFYLWQVQMRELAHPEQNYSYTIGLSSFLEREEIKRLFSEYFGTLIEVAET